MSTHFSDQLYADIQPSYTDSLMHHGIKGMHWGVRRYQNADGTLTDAGRKHYAVRESKGSLLDVNRTWMDRDLKKANELGGKRNRDVVEKQVEAALRASKEVKAAEQDCRNTAREGYAAYANLYNKHAEKMGISDRLDPKTFNWYNQMFDLDRDVDEAVWGDQSKDADRFYKIQDQHEKNVDRLIDAHTDVGKHYVKAYSDALLRDIPHDGSQQAIDRILKKYGKSDYQLGSFDYDYNSSDNDYGWGIYNLFDA